MRLALRVDPVPRGGLVAGFVGTTLVHVALVGLAILTAALGGPAYQPVVYSVELVAAPAAPPTRTTRAATPAPPPPPTVTSKPAPTPVPKPPPKVEQRVEPSRKPAETTPPNPGVEPGAGTDVENVRVEGLQFPFPDYLRNIMNQILRRWARPVGIALTAEVSFTIERDGSVRNIRVVQSSRNFTFDLEARGAVEQAGADRAFGPLPAGWQYEVLNVAFLFTPRPR